MSYRVQYDWSGKSDSDNKTWTVRRLFVVSMFFILFLGLVFHFWEDGSEFLVNLLLPGDAVLTWNALEQLMQNLYGGMPLSVAAQEFYHGVLQSVY